MSASLIFGLFHFTSWQPFKTDPTAIPSSLPPNYFSRAFWLCTTLHYLNAWTSLTTKTTGTNLFCCSFVTKQLRRPTNRNITKFPAQWATSVVNFDNSLFINHGLTNSWGRMPHSVNWYFISPTCLKSFKVLHYQLTENSDQRYFAQIFHTVDITGW